ncbi:unnamed protein product [Brassica rapa]|uniref:Secreted protein n=2 Tax=Brassica campestris TaxID=3711 RepID=A0A8D9H372_BRACM|nr:unnamed protein product [Brassica rapa]
MLFPCVFLWTRVLVGGSLVASHSGGSNAKLLHMKPKKGRLVMHHPVEWSSDTWSSSRQQWTGSVCCVWLQTPFVFVKIIYAIDSLLSLDGMKPPLLFFCEISE